jgi:hypothetical protein
MAELGLTPAARLSTPPLEDEKDEWTDTTGKVVSISKLLSDTPSGSLAGTSMPATMFVERASDSSTS